MPRNAQLSAHANYFADHPPKSSAIPSDEPKKVTASAGVLEEPLLQLGIDIE
jgi:hypothetical protein